MRKLLGFLVLSAGIAFAAFAYHPGVLDRESQLAEVTAILAAPAGDVSRRTQDAEQRVRSFAPAHPIIIPDRDPIPATGSRSVLTAKDAAPQAAAAAPVSPPANGWQAVVTPETAVPAGVTSTKPGDGHARYELVAGIQRELKRAGCYGGAAHGSWNLNTKRAMGVFMQRVNSTLPIEEPDYILLTLLKGHTSATCITCPAGQTLTEGRCLPNAIIAQRPAAGAAEPRKTETASAPAPAKPTPSATFTTTTAVAEADTRAAAPLPGRMSVGGPVDSAPATKAAPAIASPPGEGWSVRVVPMPRVPAAAVVATGASREAAPANAVPPAMAAPSPSAYPAARPVAVPQPAPDTRTAALEQTEDETAGDRQAAVAPEGPPAADAGPSAVPVQGLAGGKAGRTVLPRPNIGVTPRRERSVQRDRPARQARTTERVGRTRSVQSLFQHPLGRM